MRDVDEKFYQKREKDIIPYTSHYRDCSVRIVAYLPAVRTRYHGACWAKAHGMTLMVQDLTNPMLAQIPHCLLAAHVGTIAGVESNAMQFYPEASLPEAEVHPGIYKRSNGVVDISSLNGPGFGYCINKINRELPEPVCEKYKRKLDWA